MYRVAFWLSAAAMCAGCASSSSDIRPQYVSHLQYMHLDCRQIAGEVERVTRRVAEVSGTQDSKATQDAWMTGAAIVVFWPAAFFVKGDGATAAELGRLKGEFEALERASLEKRCNLQFRKQPEPAPSDKAGTKGQKAALDNPQ